MLDKTPLVTVVVILSSCKHWTQKRLQVIIDTTVILQLIVVTSIYTSHVVITHVSYVIHVISGVKNVATGSYFLFPSMLFVVSMVVQSSICPLLTANRQTVLWKTYHNVRNNELELLWNKLIIDLAVDVMYY